MDAAHSFAKDVMTQFHEYTFYIGSSQDKDAGCCILRYKDDGITPTLYYFLDGLVMQANAEETLFYDGHCPTRNENHFNEGFASRYKRFA